MKLSKIDRKPYAKAVKNAYHKVEFHRLHIKMLQREEDEQLRDNHGEEHLKAHREWEHHIHRLGSIDDYNKAIDRMKYLGIHCDAKECAEAICHGVTHDRLS